MADQASRNPRTKRLLIAELRTLLAELEADRPSSNPALELAARRLIRAQKPSLREVLLPLVLWSKTR